MQPFVWPSSTEVGAEGRRMISGLNAALERRWDGIRIRAEPMSRLRATVTRVPPGHRGRVVGGFSANQVGGGRMLTLEEPDCAAPDTPVHALFLHTHARLDRAALTALGVDRATADHRWPAARIERDRTGLPIGLFVAERAPVILRHSIRRAPRLSFHEAGLDAALHAGAEPERHRRDASDPQGEGVMGERPHNNARNWIGGKMASFDGAGFEPLFCAHHGRIDHLREACRRDNPASDAADWLDDGFAFHAASGAGETVRTCDTLDAEALGYACDRLTGMPTLTPERRIAHPGGGVEYATIAADSPPRARIVRLAADPAAGGFLA